MTAADYFRAGKLAEAIDALGQELRANPLDAKRRTFLFELLCFAGEYDRAQKHLEVLAGGNVDAATGALLYHAALHAERQRQNIFAKGEYPDSAGSTAKTVSGTLNGKPFQSLSDADPRVGPRMEVHGGGDYLWIPFEHIRTVEIQKPQRLRDLLWTPALVRTGPEFRDMDFGEVLTPAISPLSWKHADDAVRLGRTTVWEQDGQGREIPLGQKMLLVDDEEIPYLEVRKLEINSSTAEA